MRKAGRKRAKETNRDARRLKRKDRNRENLKNNLYRYQHPHYY